MPPFQKKRRRNPGHQPSKNELKVSRRQREELQIAQAGTLAERFPQVQEMELELRMETPWGATLEHSKKKIGLTDSLHLDATCLGGCPDGVFPVRSAIERILQEAKETHEGMGICQSSSARDPDLPCSTKLIYRVSVRYA
jgi:hypothetical protein